ncbi:hypothetical protein DIPPA_20092 [Diplonema papillatum]|nr:hypothetical protein DIPPA_20092 [Diplonema papillatum]
MSIQNLHIPFAHSFTTRTSSAASDLVNQRSDSSEFSSSPPGPDAGAKPPFSTPPTGAKPVQPRAGTSPGCRLLPPARTHANHPHANGRDLLFSGSPASSSGSPRHLHAAPPVLAHAAPPELGPGGDAFWVGQVLCKTARCPTLLSDRWCVVNSGIVTLSSGASVVLRLPIDELAAVREAGGWVLLATRDGEVKIKPPDDRFAEAVRRYFKSSALLSPGDRGRLPLFRVESVPETLKNTVSVLYRLGTPQILWVGWVFKRSRNVVPSPDATAAGASSKPAERASSAGSVAGALEPLLRVLIVTPSALYVGRDDRSISRCIALDAVSSVTISSAPSVVSLARGKPQPPALADPPDVAPEVLFRVPLEYDLAVTPVRAAGLLEVVYKLYSPVHRSADLTGRLREPDHFARPSAIPIQVCEPPAGAVKKPASTPPARSGGSDPQLPSSCSGSLPARSPRPAVAATNAAALHEVPATLRRCFERLYHGGADPRLKWVGHASVTVRPRGTDDCPPAPDSWGVRTVVVHAGCVVVAPCDHVFDQLPLPAPAQPFKPPTIPVGSLSPHPSPAKKQPPPLDPIDTTVDQLFMSSGSHRNTTSSLKLSFGDTLRKAESADPFASNDSQSPVSRGSPMAQKGAFNGGGVVVLHIRSEVLKTERGQRCVTLHCKPTPTLARAAAPGEVHLLRIVPLDPPSDEKATKLARAVKRSLLASPPRTRADASGSDCSDSPLFSATSSSSSSDGAARRGSPERKGEARGLSGRLKGRKGSGSSVLVVRRRRSSKCTPGGDPDGSELKSCATDMSTLSFTMRTSKSFDPLSLTADTDVFDDEHFTSPTFRHHPCIFSSATGDRSHTPQALPQDPRSGLPYLPWATIFYRLPAGISSDHIHRGSLKSSTYVWVGPARLCRKSTGNRIPVSNEGAARTHQPAPGASPWISATAAVLLKPASLCILHRTSSPSESGAPHEASTDIQLADVVSATLYSDVPSNAELPAAPPTFFTSFGTRRGASLLSLSLTTQPPVAVLYLETPDAVRGFVSSLCCLIHSRSGFLLPVLSSDTFDP